MVNHSRQSDTFSVCAKLSVNYRRGVVTAAGKQTLVALRNIADRTELDFVYREERKPGIKPRISKYDLPDHRKYPEELCIRNSVKNASFNMYLRIKYLINQFREAKADIYATLLHIQNFVGARECRIYRCWA